MKKLYIATTTLNVDNILSTESIAPHSFYAERKFGYNSLYGNKLTPFENVLVLFSRIPDFSVNEKELNSYPMILEILADENKMKLVFSSDGCEVYTTDDVIHLSPYNCRVLFFDRHALNSAKRNCSDSLTNKLADKFEFDLITGDFDLAKMAASDIHIDDVCEERQEKVDKENRIDKIKGFIYGYYLGVSRSMSATSANLQKLQKQVYDTMAAVKNSGSSASKYEDLQRLDAEFRKNDKSAQRWEQSFCDLGKKYLGDISQETLSAFLSASINESLIDKDSSLKKFAKYNGMVTAPSLMKYGADLPAYCDDIGRYTKSIVAGDRKKLLSRFAADKAFDLDPSYSNCSINTESERDTEVVSLFNKICYKILWDGEAPSPDNLRANRSQIATDITRKLKAIIEDSGQTWDGSPQQEYMFTLRTNISNYTPFDPTAIDSVILQSLAAFILKGEEYDAVVDFCESNAFSDYRYVLALWGASTGYVRISRPVFAPLACTENFEDNFKAISKLLFGFDPKTDIRKGTSMIEVPADDNVITQQREGEGYPIAGKTMAHGTVCGDGWQRDIMEYFESMKLRRKKDRSDMGKSLEQAFEKIGENKDYVSFFRVLSDMPGWSTSKGPNTYWKEMSGHFCPEAESLFSNKITTIPKLSKGHVAISVEEKENGKLPFDFQEECLYFYNDPETINDLTKIIGKKAMDKVEWFFDDMKKNRSDRHYYREVDEKNNKEVIDRFCGGKQVSEAIPPDKINRIRSHFYNKYGIR